MNAAYKLISVKGTRLFTGSLVGAILTAHAMMEELQPAFGVSIEDESGETVAEIA